MSCLPKPRSTLHSSFSSLKGLILFQNEEASDSFLLLLKDFLSKILNFELFKHNKIRVASCQLSPI